MKKHFLQLKDFFWPFIQDIAKSEVFYTAGDLTYRLILAIFPLITFLISLLGFLNLDVSVLSEMAIPYLPEEIHSTLFGFIYGILNERHAATLSISIIITLFTASFGFKAMMRGINKAYGITKERSFISSTLVSVLLTLIFSGGIVFAIVVILLRNAFILFITAQGYTGNIFTGFLIYFSAFFMIFATTSIIYKISANRRYWSSTVPGSLFTVCLLLLSSQALNFYVAHFPVFSLYGSIASIFILLLWLNILSTVILLGAHLNAYLEKRKI